jgi:hypothetical protein
MVIKKMLSSEHGLREGTSRVRVSDSSSEDHHTSFNKSEKLTISKEISRGRRQGRRDRKN